jgi:excisionase family DNA binding protein
MIYEREIFSGKQYEHYEVNAKTSFESPYLAGEYRSFISKEAATANELKLKTFDEPLINKSNAFKKTIKIGKEGLYFLEIRFGYIIANLIVHPDDVIVDIYFGIDDTLIYSFYNLSDQDLIEVVAKIIPDDEETPKKLRTDPTDIYWRNYFIRRARNILTEANVPKKVAKVKEHEILTAQEAADYLRISKKSLQNYVSQGKVVSLRSGKFRKKDLDSYLESKKDSRKKLKK